MTQPRHTSAETRSATVPMLYGRKPAVGLHGRGRGARGGGRGRRSSEVRRCRETIACGSRMGQGSVGGGIFAAPRRTLVTFRKNPLDPRGGLRSGDKPGRVRAECKHCLPITERSFATSVAGSSANFGDPRHEHNRACRHDKISA